jgi:hypothetical protein
MEIEGTATSKIIFFTFGHRMKDNFAGDVQIQSVNYRELSAALLFLHLLPSD